MFSRLKPGCQCETPAFHWRWSVFIEQQGIAVYLMWSNLVFTMYYMAHLLNPSFVGLRVLAGLMEPFYYIRIWFSHMIKYIFIISLYVYFSLFEICFLFVCSNFWTVSVRLKCTDCIIIVFMPCFFDWTLRMLYCQYKSALCLPPAVFVQHSEQPEWTGQWFYWVAHYKNRSDIM